METSKLLTLACLKNLRTGAICQVICVVFTNRITGEFIAMENRDAAEDLLIESGLQTFMHLIRKDRRQKD